MARIKCAKQGVLGVVIAVLIEEELLLALPIIALHPEGEACGAQAVDESDGKTQKPFAELAALLKRSP